MMYAMFQRLMLILCLCCFIAPLSALAQSAGFSTIRDDETESYLKDISFPLFRAGGLAAENVRMFIVNSPAINAFVAGGQNMFIHTALIVESDDPNMLIGVIAHETGHILGGHIVRKTQEFEQAGLGNTIGTLLGIASIAAGAPSAAGLAIVSGSNHVAERSFLKHSRSHEEAADQAALQLLEKVHISPRGLLTLLEKFYLEQNLLFDEINPYQQSHPLSQERVNHIRNALELNPKLDYPTPESWTQRHQRILGKLRGFLNKAKHTFERYPKTDQSIPARYARSVAYYRESDLASALSEIDSLIQDYPQDPYFHELRGQILFEHGQLEGSLESYQNAHTLLPSAPMIEFGLGQVLLGLNEPRYYERAVTHFTRVLHKEPQNSLAWRQLGITYGKMGILGKSYAALAEEAALRQQDEDVTRFTTLAKKHLPENAPERLRIEDLLKTKKKKD